MLAVDELVAGGPQVRAAAGRGVVSGGTRRRRTWIEVLPAAEVLPEEFAAEHGRAIGGKEQASVCLVMEQALPSPQTTIGYRPLTIRPSTTVARIDVRVSARRE